MIYRSLFKSRWLAAIRAAGICGNAVGFVPWDSAQDSASNVDANVAAADDAADMARLQAMVARLGH